QIEVLQAVAAQDIPARIAEGSDPIDLPCWSIARKAISLRGSIRQQGTGIEPPVRSRVRNMPVPDEVRTILCCAASGIALIAARKNCEGRARLKSQYSGEQIGRAHV